MTMKTDSCLRWKPSRTPTMNQFLSLLFAAVVSLAAIVPAGAQEPAQRDKWTAEWISHPTAPSKEPEVLHFRKTIHLASKPYKFIVHVSADNRFILFVNGKRMGEGPARGDLAHWRYETVDLPHRR